MKRLDPFRGIPIRAGRPLAAIPARPNRFLIWALGGLSGFYLRYVQGVRLTGVRGRDRLIRLFRDPELFPIVAFRHPSADDPIVLYSVLYKSLREAGRRVADGGYPVFIYGRDVPIWGGAVVSWALPRGGAISVFHDAVNRASMEAVFTAIRTSSAPFVLAPEGQVTYRNYRSAPNQRGAAALAVEAAMTRTDGKSVAVIPIALEYRYPDRRWRCAITVAYRIARRIGISKHEAQIRSRKIADSPVTSLVELWERAVSQLLTIHKREVPDLYKRLSVEHHHDQRASPVTVPWRERINDLQNRVAFLLGILLSRAERLFDIHGDRDSLDRVFRIRQQYWERLFPSERGDPGSVTRIAADAGATEAKLVARHMQCADVLLYAEFDYLAELEGKKIVPESSLHARFVEYLLLLDDLLQRSAGYTIGDRRPWRGRGRSCTVVVGRAIAIDRIEGAKRRREIRQLTQILESTLVELSQPRGS